jgi:hypothetical protein
MEEQIMDIIPVEKFGKDHWSLLAYIETCCADNGGVIDLRRVRVNPNTHPLCAVGQHSPRNWLPTYSTILNDSTLLYGHDDIDCLDDLEKAGMIYIKSLVNGFVFLSPLGIKISARLRKHKIEGKQYRDFEIGAVVVG